MRAPLLSTSTLDRVRSWGKETRVDARTGGGATRLPPLRVAWSTGSWVFTSLSASGDTICVGSRRPSLSPCRRGTPAHVRAPLLSTGPLDVVQTWGKEMRRTNRSRRLPVVAFLCRSPACQRWGKCQSRRGVAWNGTGRILSNGARDMGRARPTDFLRSEAMDLSSSMGGGG
jgi:hypothetical protein